MDNGCCFLVNKEQQRLSRNSRVLYIHMEALKNLPSSVGVASRSKNSRRSDGGADDDIVVVVAAAINTSTCRIGETLARRGVSADATSNSTTGTNICSSPAGAEPFLERSLGSLARFRENDGDRRREMRSARPPITSVRRYCRDPAAMLAAAALRRLSSPSPASHHLQGCRTHPYECSLSTARRANQRE